ncbi:MAG: Mut7-C RNAse domain-containing protein [Gammaproteobacteria bacterium]
MTRDTPRFLVDEMLQRLGRWLRAAGYDTRIAQDAHPDYYLLRQAIAEGRLLITCDRKILEHRRAAKHVILLECSSLEECVQALSRQLPINWQYRPFTRCLVCNTPLHQATPSQEREAPASVHERQLPARYCPTCQQVFWTGSHVKRMQRQLAHWQQSMSEQHA